MLTNSKQEALNVALDEHKQSGGSSVEDLTRAIIEDILRMPGNNVCCDCGAPGAPTIQHSDYGSLNATSTRTLLKALCINVNCKQLCRKSGSRFRF